MLYILSNDKDVCLCFTVIVQMLMILEETIIPPNSWSGMFSFLPPPSLGSVLPSVTCFTFDISSFLITSNYCSSVLDVNCCYILALGQWCWHINWKMGLYVTHYFYYMEVLMNNLVFFSVGSFKRCFQWNFPFIFS